MLLCRLGRNGGLMKICFHFALIPKESACERLRELSARAAIEVKGASFVLTPRTLKHVSLFTVEVSKHKSRAFLEMIDTFITKGRCGYPGIPHGLIRAIQVEGSIANVVEDLGYIQIKTPNDAIISVRTLLTSRIRVFARRSADVHVIPDPHGYQPHITLTHAADASAAATAAQHMKDEFIWKTPITFASLEIEVSQPFGTFKSSRVLVKLPDD
jgi:hypothetical protein